MRYLICVFTILLSTAISSAQPNFTDSSVYAGIALKSFTATVSFPKCSQNGIQINKGEKFLIASIDSCLANNVKTYQYWIRYKTRYYLADTSFVKSLYPHLSENFLTVKDRIKAVLYGAFVEFAMQNENKEKVNQMMGDKDFIRKEVERITGELKLLE